VVQKYEVKLSDADLNEFNSMLPWHAGTLLPDGRVLGSLTARATKREKVEPVPDKRITRLDQAVGLSGKKVLEIGCFEGIHTLGLCSYGAKVTAVDLRPINVIKTCTRLAAYGVSANVFAVDVEDESVALPHFDVIFHCGVLYHLEEPLRHLQRLLPHCDAIYLDTHIATEDETAELVSGGKTYYGHLHGEGGWKDPFSGRGSSAFWLKLSDIGKLLVEAGFSFELWSERAERNGPRIGLFAKRSVA